MGADDVSTVAAVLLAAGESTRMDRPKQLLEWRGVPLVQYQISQLVEAGVGEVIVVAGHRADEVLPYVEERAGSPRVHAVRNPGYRLGKTTSIKAGLGQLRTKPGDVMVFAVDQPRSATILRRLAEEHLRGGNLISLPEYAGKHGHPPLFDASLISELMLISEEHQGVREVIERHRDALGKVAMDTPLVLTNLNTMEDYERAKELLDQAG